MLVGNLVVLPVGGKFAAKECHQFHFARKIQIVH
jgi:hypothetical protein